MNIVVVAQSIWYLAGIAQFAPIQSQLNPEDNFVLVSSSTKFGLLLLFGQVFLLFDNSL